MAFALAQPNWPSLTLSTTRTNQESVAEPFDAGTGTRFPRVDVVVNSLSVQAAYNWRFLTATAGATKTQTLDYTRRSRNTNVLI